MSILDKFLSKRGVKSIDDLTPEEKATFERHATILKAKTITIADFKTFCQGQITLIEGKFAGPPSPHDVYLKACLHIYMTILQMIDAPRIERENLERYLTAIINEQ